MKRILTITLNPAIDLNTAVDEVARGRKLRCGPLRMDPGGGGVNVSRAIEEFDGQSTCFVVLGGPTGRLLKDLLRREGLNVKTFEIAQPTRQNLTVDERSTNSQFRFMLPGAKLTAAEWKDLMRALTPLIARSDFVVASGSLPPGVPADFYARLARQAEKGNARFVLDTSGAALKPALKGGVYLAKLNHLEFAELVGRSQLDWRHIADVSERMINQGGVQTMVVTRGADGALLTTADGHWRVRAPDVKLVSAIGAGDSFIAATVHRLALDRTLLEACRYGAAAAAAALLSPGTELARKRDVNRLVKKTEVWPLAGG